MANKCQNQAAVPDAEEDGWVDRKNLMRASGMIFFRVRTRSNAIHPVTYKSIHYLHIYFSGEKAMDALGIILSDNDQVAAPQFYALLF